jgi:hypothetical protein
MPQHVQPALPNTDATTASASARWRQLRGAVIAGVLGTAVFLGGVMVLVGKPDWWRGYTAATVATVLAAGMSLVPLALGIRKGGPMLVQMFMVSSATRAALAIGLTALAVGIGKYPALPTFALLIPYYLVLLALETACLTRGLKGAH